MTAAASVTAGSVRTSGCAAGISARRANAIAGLGSTWATRPAVSVDQHHRMPALVIPRTLSGPGQQPSTRLGQLHARALSQPLALLEGKTRAWNTARERARLRPMTTRDRRGCPSFWRKACLQSRPPKWRVFGRAACSTLRNLLGVSPKFLPHHLSQSPSRIFSSRTVGASAHD